MSARHGWIGVLLAVAGLGACLLGIIGFFWKILMNELPFHPMLSAREHYQAIGRAYGNGFLAGFFLCFFLFLAALAAGAIRAPRRSGSREDWARKPIAFPRRPAKSP